MRLSMRPLEVGTGQERLEIQAADGSSCALWTRLLHWECSDGLVQVQVIACEAITLPTHEASEPMIGAIARIHRAAHTQGGILLLRNPSAVFSAERIALAHGVRLFAIEQPADEALWDAALSLGQAVYGVRGDLVMECISVHPASALSALTFGGFIASEGLVLSELSEDRSGVGFTCGEEVAATVIVHGGFEAATLRGRSGRWQDRGNEAYVRLRVQSASGSCWTQPRFIAIRAQGKGGKPHA